MDAFLEDEPSKWSASIRLPYRQILFGFNQLTQNGVVPHLKQLDNVIEELKRDRGIIEGFQRVTPLETPSEKLRRVLLLLEQDLRRIDEMQQNVKSEDLDKFKSTADSVRRRIHSKIEKAKLLVLSSVSREPPDQQIVTSNVTISNETLIATEESILIEDNDRLEQKAQDIEMFAEDMRNLKELTTTLSEQLSEQGQAVQAIDQHVENALVNISRGEVLLAKARRLKTFAFPLVGMTVGFAAGGPIGAVAGTRIGFATSMLGGIVGYVGGKVLHKFNKIMPRERL